MRTGRSDRQNRARHAARHGRILVVVVIAMFVGALAVAVIAGRFALVYYQERSELRLNPVNTGRYSGENSQLPQATLPRFVFIGDSRVEQWSPQPVLRNVELIWRGMSGETTAQMLRRFDSDVLALAPAAVVIQSGINDVVIGNSLGKGKESVKMVITNLQSMATAAADSGAHVYLCTIVRPATPSLLRRLVWSDAIFGDVAAVNDAVRRMGSQSITIVDADRLLAGTDRSLPDRFSIDTLHFTTAAYDTLNQELSRQIEAQRHAVQ